MRTVPRGAGGAIPRPLLHPDGGHPGAAESRGCPEPPPRCSPSIARRAHSPPSAPGRRVVETKPRRVGAASAIEKEEVQ